MIRKSLVVAGVGLGAVACASSDRDVERRESPAPDVETDALRPKGYCSNGRWTETFTIGAYSCIEQNCCYMNGQGQVVGQYTTCYQIAVNYGAGSNLLAYWWTAGSGLTAQYSFGPCS